MVEGPQNEDVEVGSGSGSVVSCRVGVLFCYNKSYQTKFEETIKVFRFL